MTNSQSTREAVNTGGLADLLARVEKAEEGDQYQLLYECAKLALDADLADYMWAVQWQRLLHVGAWESAALALCSRVLPDTSVAVKRWASGTGDAEIGGAGVPDTTRARAKTPALALIAAMLKALIALPDGGSRGDSAQSQPCTDAQTRSHVAPHSDGGRDD